MHPARCPPASEAIDLLQLPNVGPAMAADFHLLGHDNPQSLRQADPYLLYQALCQQSGKRHDPCVLDVFIAVTHYLQQDQALPWWHFTAQRKAELTSRAVGPAWPLVQ